MQSEGVNVLLSFHMNVSNFKILLPKRLRSVTRTCLDKLTSAFLGSAQNSVANIHGVCVFLHLQERFTSEQACWPSAPQVHHHLAGQQVGFGMGRGWGWSERPGKTAASRPLGFHVPLLCCHPSPCDPTKLPGTPSKPTRNKFTKTASLTNVRLLLPLPYPHPNYKAGSGGDGCLSPRGPVLGNVRA